MPDFSQLIASIHLPTLQQVVFVMIATFTAAAALLTVLAPNVFHNAMGLVATFFGVAGIYILLEAEFLAVSQVLVYVGAISTLITFAIMLTRGMMQGESASTNRQVLSTSIVVGLLFLVMIGILLNVAWPNAGLELNPGEEIIADLGEMFVTSYLVPFELMAVLLLIALAGAIMLARDE
jgi:NADH:ubiquinone oxidoreductase subunit 6 (subunit J)